MNYIRIMRRSVCQKICVAEAWTQQCIFYIFAFNPSHMIIEQTLIYVRHAATQISKVTEKERHAKRWPRR